MLPPQTRSYTKEPQHLRYPRGLIRKQESTRDNSRFKQKQVKQKPYTSGPGAKGKESKSPDVKKGPQHSTLYRKNEAGWLR